MELAIYWDASAILSLIARDAHTDDALSWYEKDCTHLMSTLAYAETCAVLSRLQRDRIITGSEASGSLDAIASLPWKRLLLCPGWDEISEVSGKWGLRGADLWHLSLALTLRRRQLSELVLLTYDSQLRSAAAGEGLAP
jgi:predicted nucleic acid-binding protein